MKHFRRLFRTLRGAQYSAQTHISHDTSTAQPDDNEDELSNIARRDALRAAIRGFSVHMQDTFRAAEEYPDGSMIAKHYQTIRTARRFGIAQILSEKRDENLSDSVVDRMIAHWAGSPMLHAMPDIVHDTDPSIDADVSKALLRAEACMEVCTEPEDDFIKQAQLKNLRQLFNLNETEATLYDQLGWVHSFLNDLEIALKAEINAPAPQRSCPSGSTSQSSSWAEVPPEIQ